MDNGADPNALDDWRCTPLHNAAGAGHPEVVQELCEAGADTEIKSSVKSKTAIEFARDKGKFDVIPILQVSRTTGMLSTLRIFAIINMFL